jgi:hypothetical protein
MSSDDHDLDAAEAQTTTALRTYMTSEGGDDYAAITDFVEPVVDLYADSLWNWEKLATQCEVCGN